LSTPSLNSRFSPDRLLLREEPIYNEEDVPERPIIVSCMAGGECTGIDGFTGSTLWTYDCPGGKQRIPTAILEPPNVQKGRPKGLVYVGAGKTLYCLKTKTGDLQWKKKISHCMFGYSFMTMATPWSSRVAAETHSAFSQNPVAQVRDMQRDAEHVNHVY
jgi:outer membrane protein assembly factor BamB